MGALAVEVPARSALNEAFCDKLGESASSRIFRRTNGLCSIACRERNAAIVTTIVDGSQFNEN